MMFKQTILVALFSALTRMVQAQDAAEAALVQAQVDTEPGGYAIGCDFRDDMNPTIKQMRKYLQLCQDIGIEGGWFLGALENYDNWYAMGEVAVELDVAEKDCLNYNVEEVNGYECSKKEVRQAKRKWRRKQRKLEEKCTAWASKNGLEIGSAGRKLEFETTAVESKPDLEETALDIDGVQRKLVGEDLTCEEISRYWPWMHCYCDYCGAHRRNLREQPRQLQSEAAEIAAEMTPPERLAAMTNVAKTLCMENDLKFLDCDTCQVVFVYGSEPFADPVAETEP